MSGGEQLLEPAVAERWAQIAFCSVGFGPDLIELRITTDEGEVVSDTSFEPPTVEPWEPIEPWLWASGTDTDLGDYSIEAVHESLNVRFDFKLHATTTNHNKSRETGYAQ